MSKAVDTAIQVAGHKEFDTLQQVIARLSVLPQKAAAPVSSKLAAVLVPLFQDGEGQVRCVLTQRSANLSSHQGLLARDAVISIPPLVSRLAVGMLQPSPRAAGEVCLPGGKRDPADSSDVDTALREAHEELGIPPSSVQVLAQLPPFLSKHRLSVTPVVGIIPPPQALRPNPDEVAHVFDMPLNFFLEDCPSHTWKDISWEGFKYRLHFFEHLADGRTFLVWGLTAAMLIEVAEQALGRKPAFEAHTPGSIPYTELRVQQDRLTWKASRPTPH